MSSAVIDEPVWDNPFLAGLQSRARDFLGTQGDGNHFAYVGKIAFTADQHRAIAKAGYDELARAIEQRGDAAFHVLVTHHGSRGIGADLYKKGMIAANRWVQENASGIPRRGRVAAGGFTRGPRFTGRRCSISRDGRGRIMR